MDKTRKENGNMRIQEAAALILREEGKPLRSKEIAKRALDRGLVHSTSRDPVFSHATTIEKNIRDGIYNRPELVFIQAQAGRFIGLPEWKRKTTFDLTKHLLGESTARALERVAAESPAETRSVSLKLPSDLYEKIELAAHARLAESFEETVLLILKKGLSELAPAIKEGLMKQMSKLDDL